VPLAPWAGEAGGQLSLAIDGNYLVNPTRTGLRFSGGTVGGTFSQHATFTVRAIGSDDTLPLPVPAAPGDPAGVWELYRIAAPLPTILPSYNQIGFDSLHYLIGLVEGDGAGHAIAWVVGGKLAAGSNTTVVDPATRVLFPFQVTHDGGALTMLGTGFAIEFNLIRLPFEFFRIATRVNANGSPIDSPALNVSAECAGITFYGDFLRILGFCNPQTDLLTVFGGAEMRPHMGGVQQAPAGVGTVSFELTATGVTATLTGSTLRADTQSVSLLLIDNGTGVPLPLDYGFATTRTTSPSGVIETVSVPFGTVTPPEVVRAYLMVDAYPAAKAALPPH